ncbi:MAG TPA: phage tail protein [Acidimicrobiales bacterium]|jgi:phage tail-like protein|nr:phage tail protein [Acidimicrobiales bacterium]
MRGTVRGLRSAQRIGDMLPGVYQDNDPVMLAFTQGLDEVLAPIPGVLDSLGAYIDPQLAPPDFLGWLATWVGVDLDENWALDRQRSWVGNAVNLFHELGTEEGLRKHLEFATGGRVEIEDSGGIAVSQLPGADLPGDPEPRVSVRVFVSDPDSVDIPTINRLIISAKPAWVAHSLEVLQG